MKINLKEQKKNFHEKSLIIYSTFTQTGSKIAKILKNLNSKVELFTDKIVFLEKYYKFFFIASSIILYILFKLVFKTGMGGDDSRIYMFYPTSYLQEVANNKRFGALEAENNQYSYINTLTVFSFLEKAGFTYIEFYFLILYLGFIFFFLSLQEIKKYLNYKEPLTDYFIFFLALLYPCNPLMSDQVWNNHWSSIFTICGTPLIFLVFLKIIFNTLRFWQVIILNLLLTIFSLYFSSIVPSVALIICLTVVLLSFILLNLKNLKKISSIIFKSVLFIGFFLLCNSFWILGLYENLTFNPFSISTKESAENSLRVSLEMYSKDINNLSLIVLHGIVPNTNYNFLYFLSLFLFIVVIIFSLIEILKKVIYLYKTKSGFEELKAITSLSVGFLVAMYLQSISLTNFGKSFFVFLSNNFFILNGLRNYLNKVPQTYSLFILSIVFLGFIFINKKNSILKAGFIISVILFSTISFKNLIYLEDYKFNMPVGKVRNTSFDSDTFELVDFIKNHKNIERVVYLPISSASWSIFRNGENQLFIGNSPLSSFAGVDDFNGLMFVDYYTEHLQKNILNYKYAVYKSLSDKDFSKFISNIKYLGAELVIINNTFDTTDKNYMGYNNTENYENLYVNIKNNLELVYETKNKKFSVYKLPSSVMGFRTATYNIANPITYDILYYFDLENSTFINKEEDQKLVNYVMNKVDNKIEDHESIDMYYNIKKELIRMNETELTTLLEDKDEQILSFQNNYYDTLRLITESNENVLSVKYAVESDSSSCIKRIFVKDGCEIVKSPTIQKVENYLTYTTEIKNTYNKVYLYLKLNNEKIRFKDLKIKLLAGNKYVLPENVTQDNKEISKENKQKYLEKIFTKNLNSEQFQKPTSQEITKIDKDSYQIKFTVEKNNPVVFVLNKIYSDKWIIESTEIEKNIHFKSNLIFNGWVIYPKEGDKEINLKLTFKENKEMENLKKISQYSIIGSIIILLLLTIYGISKILIRKFWR